MNEPLFLIAHKVRGSLAFDVAQQMTVGEEQWWIIPTSGHRAYPWWSTPIDSDLRKHHALGDGHYTNYPIIDIVPPMPPNTCDHYSDASTYSRRRSSPTPHPRFIPTLKDALDLI